MHAPKIIKASYLSHLKPDLIETVRTYLEGGVNTSSTMELEKSVIQQIKRLDARVGNYKFLNYLIADIAESGRDLLDHHWALVTIVSGFDREIFPGGGETFLETECSIGHIQRSFLKSSSSSKFCWLSLLEQLLSSDRLVT